MGVQSSGKQSLKQICPQATLCTLHEHPVRNFMHFPDNKGAPIIYMAFSPFKGYRSTVCLCAFDYFCELGLLLPRFYCRT